MRSVRVGLIFVAAIFAAATPLLAQQGVAAITGRVTDEQGAILPGVAIVVTNEETGVFREAEVAVALERKQIARERRAVHADRVGERAERRPAIAEALRSPDGAKAPDETLEIYTGTYRNVSLAPKVTSGAPFGSRRCIPQGPATTIRASYPIAIAVTNVQGA